MKCTRTDMFVTPVWEVETDYDKNFKHSYIKNLSIGELLVLNENNIKKKITDDYNKYVKYSIYEALILNNASWESFLLKQLRLLWPY